jgi:NAD-dependent dihydropyrimidine dehydrogenase PreA subunit
MIYYFSGTGNSKWVAQELARKTGDTAQSIPAAIADGPAAVYADADSSIGIVFPVYAWGAPTIVENFCKSITLDPSAYAYAVCTCGDEAGLSMKRLKKKFAWKSAWSLSMPNNYIPGFDVDSPDLEQNKIAATREKLPVIAEAILAKAHVYEVHEGKSARLKTVVVRPMFNLFAKRTSPFYVTSDCNGCGLCERICPIHAIQLEQQKPVWIRKHCTQCTGCINRCPQKAIQYGKGTVSRGRYHMKDA